MDGIGGRYFVLAANGRVTIRGVQIEGQHLDVGGGEEFADLLGLLIDATFIKPALADGEHACAKSIAAPSPWRAIRDAAGGPGDVPPSSG